MLHFLLLPNSVTFNLVEDKLVRSVWDEEKPATEKKSCRGIASQYANPALVEQENEVASMAFSGAE